MIILLNSDSDIEQIEIRILRLEIMIGITLLVRVEGEDLGFQG